MLICLQDAAADTADAADDGEEEELEDGDEGDAGEDGEDSDGNYAIAGAPSPSARSAARAATEGGQTTTVSATELILDCRPENQRTPPPTQPSKRERQKAVRSREQTALI